MNEPVSVLHRGRFYEIEGARVAQIAANVWEIAIDVGDPIHKRVRRAPTAEGWDQAVFLIDGKESEPAVGSAENKREIRVSAFVI